MLTVAFIAILVSMGMVILRALLGVTIFDRILAVNSFGTNIIVFIALIGHYMETFFYIDIALVYALINFITTIALLRYFKYAGAEGVES